MNRTRRTLIAAGLLAALALPLAAQDTNTAPAPSIFGGLEQIGVVFHDGEDLGFPN